MDFGFSPEQEMLRATARKFLENECTSAFVRARMEEPAGVTDEFWMKLAEQGWLGLVYPEEYGGSGLGFVDLTVLMEEMGRAVMPGPFFSTVLLGGRTILEAGSPAQKKEGLPRIAAGGGEGPPAGAQPDARRGAAGGTAAARGGKGGVGPVGPEALLVEAPPAHGGGAQKVLDLTSEYAKIRVAFGKPIGTYQGVKHKAADMLVGVENAKSLTYYAAWAVDENVPEAPLAVSMAKAYTSDAYREVSGTGIQLHGGIGFTWEHDLHLYFKRAKSSEFTFGDATYHRERVAQLINL